MAEKKLWSREEALERLLKSYAGYYDIQTDADPACPMLAAACTFHLHTAKYVLVQSAQLWSADRHEYAYVFSVPELTPEVFEACRAYTVEHGEPQVKPQSGHMVSYISCLILCDRCTPEARRLVRRSRYHKSYRFSLHGWMELQTAAVSLEECRAFGNNIGRETVKFLSEVFYPRKKFIIGKR